MKPFAVILALFLISVPTAAQVKTEQKDFPRGEIFGGYNYLRLLSGNGWLDGFTVSVTGNARKWIGFTTEISGDFGKDKNYSGLRAHVYTLVLGPQFSARNGNWAWHMHMLVGASNVAAGLNLGNGLTVSGSKLALAGIVGGGMDWRRSKGHFGVRIFQLDYMPWLAFSRLSSNIRLSTGIIIVR